MNDARASAVSELLAVVDSLRNPDGGCPWDLEQTPESIAPNLIEEAFELVEAVEQGDAEATLEEAGDLLGTLVLFCRIAEQAGRLDLGSAAKAMAEKLVRRHPHVFGEVQVDGSGEVLFNWEAIKREERAAKKRDDLSALAGVPTALPALQRCQRVGAKAMAAGFRWESADDSIAKLDEEVAELREAFESEAPDAERRAAMAAELGDVLFAAAQLANYLDLDAEASAREAARRFERRYRHMEAGLGGTLKGRDLGTMIQGWNAAKRAGVDQ